MLKLGFFYVQYHAKTFSQHLEGMLLRKLGRLKNIGCGGVIGSILMVISAGNVGGIGRDE